MPQTAELLASGGREPPVGTPGGSRPTLAVLRHLWTPETGIFLALWLVLLVGGRERFFRDPGTFWHTVVGRQILDRHEFIDTDPFTCTFAGRPWVPYQWLAECAMAVLHDRLGGLDTLLVATVTPLACLYTWVARRLIRCGLHWSLAAVVVVLVVAASSSHFHVRPHVGTMLLLGVTFALLCGFEVGRLGAGRLAWLVPLFVLWTNLHGGMLGGLGTLALAVVGWAVYKLLGLESPVKRWGRLLPLGGLVVVCGLTAFVNPYGARLPRTWVEIMGAPELPQIIVEHAPLDFAKLDGWLVLLFGVLYLFVLAGVWPRWPRVTWLLPLVWLCLTYSRVRHAPLFAVTAAIALAEVWPHTCWARRLARTGGDLFRFPEGEPRPDRRFACGAAVLPVALVLVVVGLQTAGVGVPVVGRGWARLDPAVWPVELLPELRQLEREHPEGTNVFNDYLYGGFLIYHTPGLRVYVDDRCELFGGDWLKRFDDAVRHDPGRIDEWAADPRHGFDHALVEAGSPLDAHLGRAGSGWAEVCRGAAAVLYRKVPPG